nr:MAG TPA: hypothetical protein [Caudoviricetes sp.]
MFFRSSLSSNSINFILYSSDYILIYGCIYFIIFLENFCNSSNDAFCFIALALNEII